MGQNMLYDLNMGWSPSMSHDQLLQLLSMACSLGYGTVALNHILAQSPPGDHTAPFPDLRPKANDADRPPPTLPNILHRATIPFSDPAASTYRISALTRVYDLLAVRPTTDKAFQNACLTLDVPLISLDLTQHFPFHFRPKPCMAAIARGVRFEICYGQVLDAAAASDARGRANFIANMTELVRATRGRGIVISSEAKSALGLRPPADIVNLLSVWGLGREQGMEGIRSMPRSVVVNEGLKRTGFRNVIDVVKVAERDTSATTNQGNAPQPGQGTKNNKKQKRKSGDEEGQTSGKHQSKKTKLVSRDSGAGK